MARAASEPEEDQGPAPGNPPDEFDALDVPEFNRSICWGIVRVRDGLGRESSKEVYLGVLGPPWDPERLLGKWGGGTYKVYFKLGDTRVGKRTLTLPGLRKWDSSQIPGIVQEEPPPPSPTTLPPTPAQNQAVAPGTVSEDRLSRVERMLETLVQSPRSTPTRDLLEVLQLAKDVFKPAEPVSPDMMQKLFQQGLKAGMEANSSGGENSVGAAIRDIAPEALKVLGGFANRPVAPAAPSAAPPARLPAQTVTTEPNMEWAKKLAEELKRGIAANDDPSWTADWIERYVPPAVVDKMRGPEAEVMQGFASWIHLVPELGTPQGVDFVREVLAHLRGQGPEEEDQESQRAETA